MADAEYQAVKDALEKAAEDFERALRKVAGKNTNAIFDALDVFIIRRIALTELMVERKYKRK